MRFDLAVRQANKDPNARYFSGLINAVLRKVSSNADVLANDASAGRANTPGWLWQRWSKTFDAATADKIAEAHLIEPPLDLSIKGRATTDHWARQLSGDVLPNGSVRISGATGRIEDLQGYSEGAWWVQDAAAALPVALLGELKGKRVLDLCAAPGGKTAQIAAARATVTAVDLSMARLSKVEQNLKRLGLTAELICGDAARFKTDEPYDAVLCDVPCSATGTIRRHPDLPYLKTAKHMTDLVDVQAAILSNALDLTRSGGTIVYCTCSLEPEECEDQIESLLVRSRAVKRDAVGADEVFGLDHLLSQDGDLRSLPFHYLGKNSGLDGFYACRLLKN